MSPNLKSSNIESNNFKNKSLYSPNNKNSENILSNNKIDKKKNNPQKDKCYSFIIIPGNNANLVRTSMSYRSNWKECPNNATSIFHFKWQQSSAGVDFNNFNRVTSIRQVNFFYKKSRLIISKAIRIYQIS